MEVYPVKVKFIRQHFTVPFKTLRQRYTLCEGSE